MSKKIINLHIPPERLKMPLKGVSDSEQYDLPPEDATKEIRAKFCELWGFEMIPESGL